MSAAVRDLFKPRPVKKTGNSSSLSGLVTYSIAAAPVIAEPLNPKPKYKIDLSGQQADCELNYHRLLRTLVDLNKRDCWEFEIGKDNIKTQLIACVIDRAPYTTTLTLSQKLGAELQTSLSSPTLTVCLYHDATMAEVTAWESHRRLQAKYQYPNKKMYHADEKAQLNQFLSDWLMLCQQQGHLLIDIKTMGIGSDK